MSHPSCFAFRLKIKSQFESESIVYKWAVSAGYMSSYFKISNMDSLCPKLDFPGNGKKKHPVIDLFSCMMFHSEWKWCTGVHCITPHPKQMTEREFRFDLSIVAGTVCALLLLYCTVWLCPSSEVPLSVTYRIRSNPSVKTGCRGIFTITLYSKYNVSAHA